MISILALILFGLCLVILVAMSIYDYVRKVKARRYIQDRIAFFNAARRMR